MAVNSGVERAKMALQRAVGVADDGNIGPITISKVVSTPITDVLLRFNAERLLFLTSLTKWPDFGRGWTRRVAKNLQYAAEDA
jgi:lysozyme family protein